MLCAIFALGILSVELLLPLNGDNWVYQTMGWDLFAYGKLPYLGSWDVNFPGIVYLHALAIALLGRSALAFRIFDLVFDLAASLLFYKLLTRWIRPAIALTASIIYPLLYVSLAWWVAGQRDAFAVFFLLLGLELFFESMEKPSLRLRDMRVVAGGFFIAFCAIIRPTFGLWPVSVAVAYLLTKHKLDRQLWGFLLGCILALIALLLPYAFSANGLRDFYRFAIRFNLDVYSQYAQPASVFFIVPQITGLLAAVYSLAGIIALIAMRFRRSLLFPRELPRFVFLLYLMLIGSSLISLFIMRSFFLYQYLPLLLLLSPLMAYAVVSPGLLRRRALAIPLMAILISFLVYRLYPRNFLHDYRLALATGVPALDYMYNTIDNDSLTGYTAETQAVEYLKQADRDREPVEVICYNRPYLRVQARLAAATRFTQIIPLTSPARGDTFTWYQQDWRKEFVERLRTIRPLFIIFVKLQEGLLTLQPPAKLAGEIPGFSAVLDEQYRKDTVIRGFSFYKRIGNQH